MKKLFRFALNHIPRPWLIRMSYLLSPALSIVYRGNQYTDPIDGRSYKSFLPYGYGKQRSNVLAPGTLSLERHRLLWIYLKEHTNFFNAPLKVLHVAPEQAFLNRFRKLPKLDYLTTDLESPLADVKADICNLPFEDHSFDVIFCNHVLEHIPDDQKAMSELYRVMRPGGWGIFQVPQDLSREHTFEDNSITDKEERARIFGQYDHVRIYGKDYFDRLISVGFEVEPISLAERLTPEMVARYALDPKEILPVVRKAIKA